MSTGGSRSCLLSAQDETGIKQKSLGEKIENKVIALRCINSINFSTPILVKWSYALMSSPFCSGEQFPSNSSKQGGFLAHQHSNVRPQSMKTLQYLSLSMWFSVQIKG